VDYFFQYKPAVSLRREDSIFRKKAHYFTITPLSACPLLENGTVLISKSLMKTSKKVLIMTLLLNTIQVNGQHQIKGFSSVQSSLVIHTSKTHLWEIIHGDFANISNYTSAIEHSKVIYDESEILNGSERKCYLDNKHKKYVHERIIDLKYGEALEVELIDSNLPIKVFGRSELTAVDDIRTEVVQIITYRTKPAFFGRIFKSVLRKDFHKVLIGLKYYAETGGKVTKTNFKKINKAYKQLPEGGKFTARVD
jgi:hypothetical protein